MTSNFRFFISGTIFLALCTCRGIIIVIKFLNLIETLNRSLLKNIKISFTFLNIVNQKNLKHRLKQRKSLNRYDKFKMSFYSKVQKGFIRLSKKQKKRYQLINSNLEITKNEKLILRKIDKLIK